MVPHFAHSRSPEVGWLVPHYVHKTLHLYVSNSSPLEVKMRVACEVSLIEFLGRERKQLCQRAGHGCQLARESADEAQ